MLYVGVLFIFIIIILVIIWFKIFKYLLEKIKIPYSLQNININKNDNYTFCHFILKITGLIEDFIAIPIYITFFLIYNFDNLDNSHKFNIFLWFTIDISFYIMYIYNLFKFKIIFAYPMLITNLAIVNMFVLCYYQNNYYGFIIKYIIISRIFSPFMYLFRIYEVIKPNGYLENLFSNLFSLVFLISRIFSFSLLKYSFKNYPLYFNASIYYLSILIRCS